MQYVQPYMDQINALCGANGVRSLFAFGSVTRSDFRSDSDIDLLIDIEDKDPFQYADHYFAVKFGLQEILKRPIDLLEKKALKNTYLKEQIEQTKVLIYGAGS